MATIPMTIKIEVNGTQGVQVRKKVKLPKGTKYKKICLVIHTEFTQSDMNNAFPIL